MAFVYLRRSRNTRSYLLIESYRDEEGRARKRTLCYLGREEDGTDTVEKALAHWQRERDAVKRAVRSAKGERKAVLRRRQAAAEERIRVISSYIDWQKEQIAAAETERLRREREAE
jgi:hypothetical protein